MVDEQHPHDEGLGQRGKFPARRQQLWHGARVCATRPVSDVTAAASEPVDSQACCWVVVQSVQNLRTQLFQILVQVLTLQLHAQLHVLNTQTHTRTTKVVGTHRDVTTRFNLCCLKSFRHFDRRNKEATNTANQLSWRSVRQPGLVQK